MKQNLVSFKNAFAFAVLILVGSSLRSPAQNITLAQCEIESIDRTNMTLTVKQTTRVEPLTLQITSQTLLFKEGKPAITSDLAVGDEVRGSAHKDADGKIDVVRLYVVRSSK